MRARRSDRLRGAAAGYRERKIAARQATPRHLVRDRYAGTGKRRPVDDEVGEEPAAPAGTGDGRRRIGVMLPDGYADTASERGALLARVWAQRGDGWQVERIVPRDGGRHGALLVQGMPDVRTYGRTDQLAATVRVTPEDLAARAAAQGEMLVEFDALARRAVLAAGVPPLDLAIRQRLADHLHCPPWDVEGSLAFAPDTDTGTGRLDRVRVTRHPAFKSADARQAAFREAIALLPGGSDGWKIEDDPQAGTVTLIWGPLIHVPDRVSLTDLPEVLDPLQQWRLPIGVDGRGRPVEWDLTETPHLGCVGQTGSGKTIALVGLISAALVRGFELGIVECSGAKHGADFEDLRPYVRNGFWGCETELAACSVIDATYALADGRLAAIRGARPEGEEKAKSLQDLSRAEQDRIGVHPMLLVIDEASALFSLPDISGLKRLPPDNPVRVEAEEIDGEVRMAGAKVRKIAAELRSVGVHMIFATQRFTDELLKPAGGNNLKVNLGARLALGTMTGRDFSLALADTERGEWAYDISHGETPRDGTADEVQKRPGRAVFETPTRTRPLQTVYAPETEWIRRLEAAGVPRPGGAAPVLDAESSGSPEDDAIVTIESTLELTLEDLEEGLEPEPAAVETDAAPVSAGGDTESPAAQTDSADDADPGDEWV